MTILVALAIGMIADTWKALGIAVAVASAILTMVKMPGISNTAADLGIASSSPVMVFASIALGTAIISSATFASRRFLRNRKN